MAEPADKREWPHDLGQWIGYTALIATAAMVAALFVLMYSDKLPANSPLKMLDLRLTCGDMSADACASRGMWAVAIVGVCLIFYIFIQIAAALSYSPKKRTLVAFLDITFSVMPLIMCGTIFFSHEDLSDFQIVVLFMTALTAAIDVVFFGYVTYRQERYGVSTPQTTSTRSRKTGQDMRAP